MNFVLQRPGLLQRGLSEVDAGSRGRKATTRLQGGHSNILLAQFCPFLRLASWSLADACHQYYHVCATLRTCRDVLYLSAFAASIGHNLYHGSKENCTSFWNISTLDEALRALLSPGLESMLLLTCVARCSLCEANHRGAVSERLQAIWQGSRAQDSQQRASA